jgi:hypothetical protein
MMFVYLVLTLVSSTVNEWIASMLQQRGRNLFHGIKNLLNDPNFTGLAQQLYSHGLIDGISKVREPDDKRKTGSYRLPSYMGAETFALALVDLLGSRGAVHAGAGDVPQRDKELAAAEEALAKDEQNATLIAVVKEARANVDAAVQAMKGTPEGDAFLQHREADQKAAAAGEGVKGPRQFGQLQEAAKSLEQALEAARDIAKRAPITLNMIQTGVEQVERGRTKETLLVLLDKTRRELSVTTTAVEHEIDRFRDNVERWFDNSMRRVEGWYKRWTQIVVVGIACFLVGLLNVDSVVLAKRLMSDGALRNAVVAAADKAVHEQAGKPEADRINAKHLLDQIRGLNLPLGWIPSEQDPYKEEQIPVLADVQRQPGPYLWRWFLKLLGWLLTVAAVSLGAPFWFDTLSKVVNLRGAGTPPGEKKKSAGAVQPARTT